MQPKIIVLSNEEVRQKFFNDVDGKETSKAVMKAIYDGDTIIKVEDPYLKRVTLDCLISTLKKELAYVLGKNAIITITGLIDISELSKGRLYCSVRAN